MLVNILGAESPRYGLRSLWFAAVGFALVLVSFMTFVAIPDNYTGPKLPYFIIAFMLASFVVAPLLHVFGIVNGVRQLSRSKERHWLGFTGAVLNVGLLLTEGVLVYLIVRAMGRVP